LFQGNQNWLQVFVFIGGGGLLPGTARIHPPLLWQSIDIF